MWRLNAVVCIRQLLKPTPACARLAMARASATAICAVAEYNCFASRHRDDLVAAKLLGTRHRPIAEDHSAFTPIATARQYVWRYIGRGGYFAILVLTAFAGRAGASCQRRGKACKRSAENLLPRRPAPHACPRDLTPASRAQLCRMRSCGASACWIPRRAAEPC